jgi:hypothetical protein
MFLIEKKSESGFQKVILKNDVTKNYVSVLPGCSAMLHEYVVEKINVIESYKTYEELKN